MRLSRPLLRLPISFDAERLSAEVAALDTSVWQADSRAGTSRAALVDTQTTRALEACPYARQLLAAFATPVTFACFEREDSGQATTSRSRGVRVCLPVVTARHLRTADGALVGTLSPGEAWAVDADAGLIVDAPQRPSLQLTFTTVGGSPFFWDLVADAERQTCAGTPGSRVRAVRYRERAQSDLKIENEKALHTTEERAETVCGNLCAPVFIVAAPRSGSTLLFDMLARAPRLYTVGGESHALIEGIAALTPAHHGFASNCLSADDATPAVAADLRASLWQALRDRHGQTPAPGATVRLLEKTPKNALRIPFLSAVFSDARFIYLHRAPDESLGSIIDAWASGRFVTYPDLPGWDGPPWSLLLIPEWQKLRGHDLATIAAAQWESANEHLQRDLSSIPRERWTTISYAELLADPQRKIEELARFAELDWDTTLPAALPLSRTTVTPPRADKWRRHEQGIRPHLPRLTAIAERARQLDAVPADASPNRAQEPFRSIHTNTFPMLLQELRASLLVTTYQAGKLVVLRSDGDVLNTHFRDFAKPMGLALTGDRLAIGTMTELREYRDVPAVTSKLQPEGKHDACFMPRSAHVTGNIQIHDIAFAEKELWCVNTSFSCLCTISPDVSFVPRWRPRFISALAPEDRCHLNGLAVINGAPRFVTALGESDVSRGWRAHKKDGGVLMDVTSHEVIVRGLSMPHSPRWYRDRLWVLNSGVGGVGVVDLASGRYEEVVRLPGFTRGLDFVGRFAVVGLSQVRESAVFSGIAIAELPVEQRFCGVWVIDIESGRVVAFVRFEGHVQEVFGVQVVAGKRYPELVCDRELIASSFVLPDAALMDVPSHLRSTASRIARAPRGEGDLA